MGQWAGWSYKLTGGNSTDQMQSQKGTTGNLNQLSGVRLGVCEQGVEGDGKLLTSWHQVVEGLKHQVEAFGLS